MLNQIQTIFEHFISYSIIIVDCIGVLVLLWTVFKGLWGAIKKVENIRLKLGEGIALALQFKIASELLRTVIVRDFSELGVLGLIIILRAAMAFLIHWEIKNERNHSK